MKFALIASWLHLLGCQTACQAGLIGNFMLEVGDGLNPCTQSKSGIGLPQLAGILRRRYLIEAGPQWCDAKRQVEFVVKVLGEIGIKDRLFRMRDPAAAAVLVLNGFEKPRNRTPYRRIQAARWVYGQLIAAGAVP